MKQKLALSCALIHRPSVLFLDEPTTGVDAVSRREFWELLRNLQKENITIVVSTPYMDEASLCDRVALIQEGRILDIDSPKGITDKFNRKLWAVKADNMYQLMQDLRNDKRVHSCYPFGQEHHVVFRNGEGAYVIQQLRQSGHPNIHSELISATIEDCFMALMTEKANSTTAAL
jgi:ABC-type multidrug transport system ATPase subunit